MTITDAVVFGTPAVVVLGIPLLPALTKRWDRRFWRRLGEDTAKRGQRGAVMVPTARSRGQCGCHRWPGDPCEQPAAGGDRCDDCRRGCDFVAECYDRPGAGRQHTWHGREVLVITVQGLYRTRTRAQVFDAGWMLPYDTLRVSWALREMT